MPKICLRCGSKFGSYAEYCPHDGTVLTTAGSSTDPLLGTVLLEQFRIDEQIGVGGMGTVYRAHQTTIGRDVAVKVLRMELARDEQAVVRFEREARLATALDHPNLVRVFLSGRLPDGRLYIVMELLEGRSLFDELEANGPPSLERALVIIMKLCAGLGAVHAAGIVHRDIKPENVYLVRRGRDEDFVKLVDFGVARVLAADGVDPSTTQSGRVFGTATYISPEAATGSETDHRSDIYSLAVVAYQLLTGELPFQGSTAGSVLMKHVHEEPPDLRTRGRGARVPPEVASVIMRALRKKPAERQQTLSEFLDALAQAAGASGLLNDARALLLGTVWGDELAAPDSYLAELLGSSPPSSIPPPSDPSPVDDAQQLRVERDPEVEALLSSAPKPFGTTSFDLAPVHAPTKRRAGWLWGALALVGIASFGLVAGAWLREPAPAVVSVAPTPAPAEPWEDQGPPMPDPEPAPLEPVAAADQPLAPKPAAKPKARKKRKTPRKKVETAKPEAAPAPAPAPAPEPSLEPDDGIDWSIPAFSEEPAPPTGTPDAPARNPVVIDEPPR